MSLRCLFFSKPRGRGAIQVRRSSRTLGLGPRLRANESTLMELEASRAMIATQVINFNQGGKGPA